MKNVVETEYSIGQVVKHKFLDFRGVIYDVDPEFNNTEEWYKSIPAAIRPIKEQPFYHVFAENDQVYYTAYVSQQNLLQDESEVPVEHPDVEILFGEFNGKSYKILEQAKN
ncbi:MAG: heat shock protein HspQ [SAR86 cluster bacterium]|jgi:heat shock protein HspQ|nr:heat shock protein HspQ [SAR86 cluster bacterium]